MNDEACSSSVTVPWFVCDEEFIEVIKKISSQVETLNCSNCINLTQEAFLQLSREETVFPKLKHLIVPENSPYPDLVYECLSYMTPSLEQLTNVRQNIHNTCDQLKCLSYFKKSNIKILQDNPVSCYGRISSQNEKQKRQRWEQDLAKIAISCQKIESYKCCGGRGYLDDKSLERLSVLMPGLVDLELRRCSVTDEGFNKFFTYNKSNKIKRIVLDDAGQEITDKCLKIVSENCPMLCSLALLRLEKVTKYGIEKVIKAFPNLLELELGIGTTKGSEDQRCSLDESVLLSIGDHCIQMGVLKLHSFDLSFKNICKSVPSPELFMNLKCLSFHDCQLIGTLSVVEFLAQLPRLSELSFIDCRSLAPETLVNLIVKLTGLKRLTLFCQHKSFYSDVAPIAKDAYTMLTSENGGRFKLSSIEYLTVQGVSGQFLRLLTALCSRVVTLDFRLRMLPKIKASCIMDCLDLVEALNPCESLNVLEITSSGGSGLPRPKLSDQFFKTILDRLPRLTKLNVDFSLDEVNNDTVVSFLRNVENLKHLTLNMTGSNLDEEMLRSAIEQERKGRCLITNPLGQEESCRSRIMKAYLPILKQSTKDIVEWI